ncbi:Winged helix DNA-binding domain-containing protein [Mycena sanguinolenta]|uniref:Winged helix DNA-binding domain-containing protein n=1 Tax=Mycena sanguinolenta TaxID=230812 RepID=A0A8H6ZAN3_9AGAR|nr:Winged helix DNA-binding domain-containing protein [Mycena sanguinolenta]
MSEPWFNGFNPFDIDNPLSGVFQSYHSSDESGVDSSGGLSTRDMALDMFPLEVTGMTQPPRSRRTDSFWSMRLPTFHHASLSRSNMCLRRTSLDHPTRYNYFQEHYQQYYAPQLDEQWTSGTPQPYSASPEQYHAPPSDALIPTAMPPSAFQQTSRFPDAGDYLQNQLNLPPGSPEHYPQYYAPQLDEHRSSGTLQAYSASPEQYYAPPSGAPIPTAMPPSAFHETSRFPDAGDYLRNQLNLPPGGPVNLWSLPEPPNGQKPAFSIPVLIKFAIYGSPRKRLTLQEICGELCNRFTWFREHQHERAWKNSIRHNLSLKAMFVNTPRPTTDPGRGSYWELDITAGDGDARERKRGKRSAGRNENEDHADYGNEDEEDGSFLNTGGSAITGDIRGGQSLPMLESPAQQRRPATYSQPGYGPAYAQHNPDPTPGPSSFRQPSGQALAASFNYLLPPVPVIVIAHEVTVNAVAAMAQCPYTGVSPPLPLDLTHLKIAGSAVLDMVKQALGLIPAYIPVISEPNTVGTLTTEGTKPEMFAICSKDSEYKNQYLGVEFEKDACGGPRHRIM